MESQVKVLKRRLHRTSKDWIQGTNEFKRAIGAAVTKATQVATTISGEAEQEIGEELGDAKIAVLDKLGERRSLADASVQALSELADSTERNWMTDSVRQG